jgi:hypothetical protein
MGTPLVSGAAAVLTSDEPALWFSDANGGDRLILTTDGMRLANSKSQPGVDAVVGVAGQPAVIRFYDSQSRVVWSAP